MAQWRTKRSLGGLAFLAAMVGLTAAAQGPPAQRAEKYASEPNQHKFLGATRVVIDKFNPDENDAKTATLLLDKNSITLNAFGDFRGVTAVLHTPLEVKLTRLRVEDPLKQGRQIFTVQTAAGQEVGKAPLRLVWTPETKERSSALRLVLLDDKENVIQTLELKNAKKTEP